MLRKQKPAFARLATRSDAAFVVADRLVSHIETELAWIDRSIKHLTKPRAVLATKHR